MGSGQWLALHASLLLITPAQSIGLGRGRIDACTLSHLSASACPFAEEQPAAFAVPPSALLRAGRACAPRMAENPPPRMAENPPPPPPPLDVGDYRATASPTKWLVSSLTAVVNALFAPEVAARAPELGERLSVQQLRDGLRDDYTLRNYLWTGDIDSNL